MKQKQTLMLVAISAMLLGCFSVQTVANESVKIMPLGDSITRGWWGSLSRNGYRKPLYDKLTAAGYNFDFVGNGTLTEGNCPDPNHEGHDGWHADTAGTNDILGQVYNWLTACPADIILLHIGTNDITYSGQNANEVNAILNEIDRFSTDIKVILALIINRTDNPTKIQITTQFNIDVNNMAQNRIAAGDDITIVNMESALNYATNMADSVHPNDNGYAKMADVWYNALDSLLNPPFITSAPITNATVSQLYSYDVNASGYPEPTYTLIISPNDMAIDHNTGLIEWLPASAGDFNVTVKASNGQVPDVNQSFVIAVDPFAPLPRIITGYISESNDVPIKDVSILTDDANGGSYVTDANGRYEVPVPYGWSGTVIPGKTGYTFEPNSIDYNNVTTNQNDNYTAILDTFIISGYAVDSTLAPLAGVLVAPDNNGGSYTSKYYGGGSDTTDVNGYYEVLVDYNWSGNVVPSRYAFQPNSIAYTNVTANILDQNYVGTLLTYKIAGYIKNSCEVPIKNVHVDANNGGNSYITDDNGYYEIWVDCNWSGTVTPSKAHYTFDPNSKTYTDILEDKTGQGYLANNIYDLDCDGSIGYGDIAVIDENWLRTGPNVPGDIHKDEDNIVNPLDFADFALVW